MSLAIKVIDRTPRRRYGVSSVLGEINIGDFKESLYIPLDWWSIDDYERQWKEGIIRLADHDTSCLVTTIHNPHKRKFINWWLLYKEGDRIFIQNQILIAEIYDEQIGVRPFTVENCYRFIKPRETVSDDGMKVSEWVVDLKGIQPD